MSLITVRTTVSIPGHSVGDCLIVDDTITAIQQMLAVQWLVVSTCTPGSSVPFQPGLRLADLSDVAGTIVPGVAPVEDGTGFFRMTDVATQAELNALASLGALTAVFSRPGVLALAVGAGRWPSPRAGTILGVLMAVGTAPTGQAIVCDVNKGGATIFTTQANRPTIAAGQTTSGLKVPDITAVGLNDLFSVDVDQVGSGVAGSDLTAVILFA